jgi:general secretion pathway protein A
MTRRPGREHRGAQSPLRADRLREDVVLIIDEAQDLDLDCSNRSPPLNLETDRRKLLQIVLIGQPELREQLDARGLGSCDSASPSLPPRPSTAGDGTYIAHRIIVAGCDRAPTFTPWAIRRIRVLEEFLA